MQVARSRVCSLLLLPALMVAMTPSALAESNVLFIFDASGSMKKAMPSGESRMDAAKKAMGGALATMPADVRLGLLLYGHRRAKDCTDIELVSPIGADDAGAIGKRINALTAKGETPIAESLKQGMRSYAALKGQDNRMILVTDGIEECGGNVCAAAQEVRDAGFDLKVDVVGFTLTQEQRALIQCVPDVTGGQYYDAQNMAGLTTALQKAVEAPDNNILAAKNGGRLLSAPNDAWQLLNDGADKRATTYDGPGVWSFRDGKPATFDTFEVLIPGADQYNLKDFELLVGDEGPLGSFRSIGQFTAQNMKLMKSPYQPFKFEPVTARYLKVVLKTHQGGGYIAAYEFRVQGTVDEAAEATPVPPAPVGTELLAQKNGGRLLAAPNEAWQGLNDGKTERTTTYDGDGVWQFKDGKPATFSTFEVLIPGTDQYNLLDFELLAGDEGPLGSFRSIGQFSISNIKMMDEGWQRFDFAPTTARYLKVGFRSNQGGGYVAGYELRLFGTLDEAAAAAATAAAAAPQGVDLLSPKNGGQLRVAPFDSWNKLTAGKAERATSRPGEGTWSFKDGKPATFDTFELFIPGTEQYNLRDFELFAGDEGPAGTFRSLGQFTAQNLKMMPDGWQRFVFAPTTARFFKVGFLSDQGGGYIAGYGLRLFGTVDESAPAVPPPAPPAGIDLLAQKNGGMLLGGANEKWAALNDGKLDRLTPGVGEGIWAFKDEKPATFDTFETFVPEMDQYNLKDFELLAATESPAGPFMSIGEFSTQNAKVMPDGYQRFSFPPVSARYFKVVLKSHQGGGYIATYEFRLFGQPAP